MGIMGCCGSSESKDEEAKLDQRVELASQSELPPPGISDNDKEKKEKKSYKKSVQQTRDLYVYWHGFISKIVLKIS